MASAFHQTRHNLKCRFDQCRYLPRITLRIASRTKPLPNAKRLALSRRNFLISACGAASTLLAFNAPTHQRERRVDFSICCRKQRLNPRLAQAQIGRVAGEFIFDVQGHFVDPNGPWLQKLPARLQPLSQMPKPVVRWLLSQGRTATCVALARRSSSRTCSSIPIPT